MKALTIHQPWAQLVAVGVKTIETRSWATKYRGPLLIHAGAQREHSGKFIFLSRKLLIDGRIDQPTEQAIRRMDVPFGAIVASCELADVVPIVSGEQFANDWIGCRTKAKCIVLLIGERLELWKWHDAPIFPTWTLEADIGDQRPYGDFTPGRFAWLLEDIKPVELRCPWCSQFSNDQPDAALLEQLVDCRVCHNEGRSQPIPAKGRQGLWEWTP